MTFQILEGDVLTRLPELPDESVHCCVTSPPYWGLRCYGNAPTVWGGDPGCAHEWGAQERGRRKDMLPSEESEAGRLGTHGNQSGQNDGGRCRRCGCWSGDLGLEPTPELYTDHMVQVFREVRRVLRPEGSLWLNLGDCYCSGTGGDRMPTTLAGPRVPAGWTNRAQPTRQPVAPGLKPKDLVGIPERVVLALQADGWYWRSRIPWLKRNGTPESTTDRPTSMVEYIFLLSKSEEYYYDREAVRLSISRNTHPQRGDNLGLKARQIGQERAGRPKGNRSFSIAISVSSRARRNSDWFMEQLQYFAAGGQGLMLDEAGDPLAMLVNPQPFVLEMCGACELIYEPKDYRQLTADCSCPACKRSWTESGPKLSRACPSCGSASIQHARVCSCGAKQWVSHFATFPERLVEPCILAGTSEHGCCSVCGAPYERIVERAKVGDWHPEPAHKHDAGAVNGTAKWAKGDPQASGARAVANVAKARAAGKRARDAAEKNGDPVSISLSPCHDQPFPPSKTLGWRPTCEHARYAAASLFHAKPASVVPCIVLDPFGGSGRAGLAANRLGRDAVLIELNSRYAKMAEYQAARLRQGTEVPAVPAI